MRSRLFVLALLTPVWSFGQGPLTEESYLKPPKEIEAVVLAPRHENVSLTNLSPDRTRFLTSISAGMPTIAQMSRPYVNLAGVMIDPKANRARTLGYRSPLGYRIVDATTGKTTHLLAPKGSTVSGGEWSPDGKQIAFFAHFDDASYLYVADVASGRIRQAAKTPGMLSLTSNLQWADSGKRIFAVFVPEPRMAAPNNGHEPAQPMVRVNEAGRNRTRTYPSLLSDLRSQEQLEYLTTGQFAWVDPANGRLTKIGKPSMIRSFNVSPDGRYARVTTTIKPFSYFVPASSFGRVEELWDESGKVLSEISRVEIRAPQTDDGSDTPPAQRPDAKRNLTWLPNGQGMSFLQQVPAQRPAGGGNPPSDGGDEQGRRSGGGGTAGQGDPAAANRPDRLYHWSPPFGADDAKVVYESPTRINSAQYSADMGTLFMSETQAGQNHVFAVKLSEPAKKLTISRSRPDEFFRPAGSLMTMANPLGVSVVRTSADGNTVYLQGTQYFENPDQNAPRPFIDQVSLVDGAKTRIWESGENVYETEVAVLDEQGLNRLIVSRQSPTEVANSYLLNLATKAETKLTSNRDVTPQVSSAQRYRVQVTRPDGFKFWVKVTTPSWHVKGNKLPAMFWFYPREFENQAAYDRAQRTHNKNTFTNVGAMSMETLTLLGYAVIQPDAPIVGPTARKNDMYVHDLRNNLAATIDALESQGIIDRAKLAVGGHSYGAFSTANAMVHTPFFKAGIAGDGNYNRTLTPMAFQSETRILWEARETYMAMSPILYADQMTGALLMYHGAEDQNVGTDPINSVRMFHALLGLGKPVAMYMYPYEDHGPAARETLLDMWARWVPWLDKYVKGNS